MEQIKSWDEAAADYQRVFRMGLNDYNRQLLEFFTSEDYNSITRKSKEHYAMIAAVTPKPRRPREKN